MAETKVTVEVINILGNGKCSIGQKVGDVYRYPEDLGKMCPHAFYILYPWIMVMQSGGSFETSGDGHDYMTVGYTTVTGILDRVGHVSLGLYMLVGQIVM